MKIERIALLSSLGVLAVMTVTMQVQTKHVSVQAANVQSHQSLSSLYKAVCAVESSNSTNPMSKRELPSGELGEAQIRPCVIEDLKLFRDMEYSKQDRLNPVKSFEIFDAYTRLWIQRRNLEDTYENRARIWNGGPTGYRKEATLGYWAKVQSHL